MGKKNKSGNSSKNNQPSLTELLNSAIENHSEEKVLDSLSRRFDCSTIEEVKSIIEQGFPTEERSLAGNFKNTLKKLAKPTRVNDYAKFSKSPNLSEITNTPIHAPENA